MENESKTKRGLTMEITNVNDYAAAYGLSYEEALSELRGTEVWQMLQPVGVKGMTRRFLHVPPGKNWQADLVDVRRNSRDPIITAYILVLIDQGSRRVAVAPLQTKKTEEVSRELLKLFRSPGMPTLAKDATLLTDAGNEFIGSQTLNRLKNAGITLVETESVHKAAIVERFIGTLRRLLMIDGLTRYRSEQAPIDYLEQIPRAVGIYNNRKHGYFMRKLSPNEAVASPELAAQFAIAQDDRPAPEQVPKFKVGEWVRVLRWRRMFEKSDDVSRWSVPMQIELVRMLDGVWCYRTRLPNGRVSEDFVYEHDMRSVPEPGSESV
jgi:hypothetical protein